MLDKNAILTADDVVKELVNVPEWGGDVYVKGMTGAERDGFEASIIQMRGRDANVNFKNIRAKLASLTICDESGKRLFTDDDVISLSKKSAVALQRIFPIAQRLSGIGEADVKELAEGLKENPTVDSASA
jgi:hypothetical protein